nr:hypothetical protein [Micromonospora cremea]
MHDLAVEGDPAALSLPVWAGAVIGDGALGAAGLPLACRRSGGRAQAESSQPAGDEPAGGILEGLRINAGDRAADRAFRGRLTQPGQRADPHAQPGQDRLRGVVGPLPHRGETVSVAGHRKRRDQQDRHQRMPTAAGRARVGHRGERLREADQAGRFHTGRAGLSQRGGSR